MRLRELFGNAAPSTLSEEQLRKDDKKAMTKYDTWPAMNNNNNPYLAFRFGVALAASPDGEMDRDGEVGGNFVSLAYTDEDEKILKHAAKLMGVKSTSHNKRKSEEPLDTNKVSPVPKPKKNKYGI
jgi:hypothetical protein